MEFLHAMTLRKARLMACFCRGRMKGNLRAFDIPPFGGALFFVDLGRIFDGRGPIE